VDNLIRDIKYATRSLLRDKGFAVTVLLTLAVCIAANTATFAIVNSVLLRPLPGPHADAVVILSNRYPNAGAGEQFQSSVADYFDRLRQVTALEEQALFRNAGETLNINGTAEQVEGMAVTPSLFKLVGIPPAYGRAFTPEEGELGGNRKVILSNALWRQLYGGERSAIGRDLRLGGIPFTIVGVMPKDFVFVNPDARFWTPLSFTAEQKTEYHSNNMCHIGRLKPGATAHQAQAQVDALNAANLERFPAIKQVLIDAGFHTKVEPLQRMLVKDVEGSLYLLWGGAVFVLLIGALNIANLVLARLSVHSKEIATRLALGATRFQVVRCLVVENVLVAASGGVAGVLLGSLLLRVLNTIGLDRFPRASEVRIDGVVILVALALAVFVGLLNGLAPLVTVFRGNLSAMLHDGSRTGTTGARTRRLRQALVGAEIGFAFVLLAGAGLLLASFRHLLSVDPGFTTTGVLTASTNAPRARYRGGAELRTLMSRTLDSLLRVPGVAAAGATNGIPFGGNNNDSVILPEGHVMKPGESVISPRNIIVTPGYFETMKIALVRGRYFEARDNETTSPVIIVDERLANVFWPKLDPIGRRMYRPEPPDLSMTDAKTRWFTVVGVVRSVRLEDLAGTRSAFGAYYFPYAQDSSRDFTIAVRTTTDPGSMSRSIRAAIAGIDPELALFDVRTMGERAELSVSSRRTSMMLALAFASVALFLSGIGIYGVLAYLVAQRRREIGIRMALGCTGAGIVRLVLLEGSLLVVIGLASGLAGAAALQKAVANQVYGVRPLDPLVLGCVVVLLGFISLVACMVPARHAVRVDPVRVLSDQ